MGQVLHGSATTTEAVRRAIQHSQASLRTLARRHGINPKTVAKWRKRTSTADVPTGPEVAKSTVLTIEQEAVIVAFRRHTLLPLDNSSTHCRPRSRSSRAHRCLTPRHLTPALGRRRENRQEQVQDLPEWLLPHRHRQGTHITAVPYCVHTVLTDNGIPFTTPVQAAQLIQRSARHRRRRAVPRPPLRTRLRLERRRPSAHQTRTALTFNRSNR